ncbi:MAG TPA: hypothetical protein VFT64_08170 [Rickettsiales bacterium]|nr:hypothetical protein [Rickettsiales bacterium]
MARHSKDYLEYHLQMGCLASVVLSTGLDDVCLKTKILRDEPTVGGSGFICDPVAQIRFPREQIGVAQKLAAQINDLFDKKGWRPVARFTAAVKGDKLFINLDDLRSAMNDLELTSTLCGYAADAAKGEQSANTVASDHVILDIRPSRGVTDATGSGLAVPAGPPAAPYADEPHVADNAVVEMRGVISTALGAKDKPPVNAFDRPPIQGALQADKPRER